MNMVRRGRIPKQMGYQLVMKTRDGVDRRFEVREGRTTIGRGVRCDVRIVLPKVSSAHCEIMMENQQARLVNLDEIMGTLLNGVPVQQAELTVDDELTVGPVTFTLHETSDSNLSD
jgi:pSer/pThr/pTyr-binding forkhead associated (FHA) protein